jgi:uncharacterized protein YjiK
MIVRQVIGGNTTASAERVPGPKHAQFLPAKRIKTGVKEASDVVGLPDGRMLVVCDRSDKVVLLGRDGKATTLELPGLAKGKASQFEGVTYDPVRQHLFLSREEARELWCYHWDPAEDDAPELDCRIDLKNLTGPSNKGIEGLAYLPAAFSPTGKPHLLVVKEGKPREVLLFSDGGKKRIVKIELDRSIKDVCKDFSAITVDPTNGHVFIASDESSSIAEIALELKGKRIEGRTVQVLQMRDDSGEPLARIEGVAFNNQGDLFVLTENNGALLRLKRQA